MQISKPVYRLKRAAKLLAKKEGIPLHAALDRVAAEEGFGRWGLLAAKHSAAGPAQKLFARLAPGDLVLVGARPLQGKTLFSLELVAEAMKRGQRAAFFSFEFTEKEAQNQLRECGVDEPQFERLFALDCSDDISADLIIKTLADAPRGALAVIDYLQVLDQKRQNPDLSVQVRALHAFARENGLILVFIAQIDRGYDPAEKPYPDLEDVRLPNALDLGLFNKMFFLNDGQVRFQAAA